MADTAALYGLVGAIGGALLGAGAALAVPLLQNKSMVRARNWELADAEINRLIKIRSSTRAVIRIQAQTIAALGAGREVMPESFSPAMSAALSELQEAADAALADGLVFPTLSNGDLSHYESRPPQEEVVTSPVLIYLQSLGDDISSAVHSQAGRIAPATISSLEHRIAGAERLRGELISLLLDRVEMARRLRGAR